jgi:hypothetical protein
MKAYVILAHKNPLQLNRLIHSLCDGRSTFFIHIDKAADIVQFDNLKIWGNKINFVPREKTSWASYRLVEAVLHGLNAVRSSGLPFQHVILLSGQDYPIKSNEFINRFTEANAGKTFIEYYCLPDNAKWQPNGGLYRINKYFMGMKFHQRMCSKSLNFLSRYLRFLKRRPCNDMNHYAGSMWWMMNLAGVNYVLDFIKQHPRYVAFHKYTFAPDEVFFHSILLNARDKNIIGSIVNTDMRYIRWKDKFSSHPEVIGKEHLQELMESPALFARKFDTQADEEILNLIDRNRLTK